MPRIIYLRCNKFVRVFMVSIFLDCCIFVFFFISVKLSQMSIRKFQGSHFLRMVRIFSFVNLFIFWLLAITC